MNAAAATQKISKARVILPEPRNLGGTGLNEVLQKRRSVRRYRPGELTLTEASQLLWAAQGVSSRQGYRTAPSAGALYGLEIHLAAGDVAGLEPGAYRYHPADHRLTQRDTTDHRAELATAAHDQRYVGQGAAVLVVTGVYHRLTAKYGQRGVRYTHMEAGHVAQNVLLMATSLTLGAVPIGAFDDAAVTNVLKLPADEQPLYLIPVGRH